MLRAPQNASNISQIPGYWASQTPQASAIVDGGRTVSYSELWIAIQHAADVLRSNGVMAGDRVMVVSENCIAQVVFLFAAAEMHAWPVVVNARLSAREVDEIAAHCAPRLRVFTNTVSPEAQAHGERVGANCVNVDHAGPVLISAPDHAAQAEPLEVANVAAALIYTSGTTGAPKGVMVTHRGLINFARISSTSRSMTADDVVYAALPISHIFGMATVLLATMYAGASLYLQPRFAEDNAFDALALHKVSILLGVPTMFRRLVDRIASNGRQPDSPYLRYLYAGGAPLDPGLKNDIEEKFDLPLNHGYGMTEYAGSLFITSTDRPRKDCSSGYLVQGAEIRIADGDGHSVPFGKTGEMWVRGPGVMLGYYRAPELTAEVITLDGWLKTGDIGRLEGDGALFVVGRTKEIVIVSGFNVYPVEVETVLNSYPGVKQSAVVGRPAGDGNEEVVAFVETEPEADVDIEGITAYLKSRLASYKRPRAIYRLATIPTTLSGKLKKQELKAQARELA